MIKFSNICIIHLAASMGPVNRDAFYHLVIKKKLPSPSKRDHRKIWQTHPFQKIPFSTLSESSSLIRGGRVFRFFLTNAYANLMKGRNDKWPMTCLKNVNSSSPEPEICPMNRLMDFIDSESWPEYVKFYVSFWASLSVRFVWWW